MLICLQLQVADINYYQLEKYLNSILILLFYFYQQAHNIWVYGAFLQNYSRAVDTVRKCSQNNAEFCEIAKNIRLKSLQNQAVTLETLLYSPVSRVQKNTEIIQVC